jgi:hypothetical protein
MHGGILSKEYHGAAVSGPENPNWKHGRFSKEVLREEAALRDMVDRYYAHGDTLVAQRLL